MKRRLFSIITALALCLSLLPATALAETGVTYYDWNSSTKTLYETTCPNATEVTSGDTGWGTSGNTTWYVVNSDVAISSCVTVSGDVHLILADGYTLTVTGGINVSSSNSLTIYGQSTGTGALTATGGDYQAGIGGGKNTSGGTITINGGIIEASSKTYGAGIGGGGIDTSNDGSEITINGGEITINGGVINAEGGNYPGGTSSKKSGGAGIGGGGNSNTGPGSPGGTITINGGNVTATGGYRCAGIGGGGSWGAGVGGSGGSITITGGKVTAKGYGRGAGIGGGASSDASSGGSGGTINISGGEINATGGTFGAGIGSGKNAPGGTINISGGEINANGGSDGAGIGGGYEGDGGSINISGGTVTATGTDGGAGIGGGVRSASSSGGSGGSINISGGTVTATGSDGGAGIGGGKNGDSGNFTTTESGNAIIKANSISDNDDKAGWSGIIFEGINGGVYGTQSLSSAFTVATGENLLITENATLNAGSNLTNNGTVYVDGTLNGTVSDNVYYRLFLTNCTASSGTSTYLGNTYATQGASVTLTATITNTDNQIVGWDATEGNRNGDKYNISPMPAKVVTVTANIVDALTITTQPQSASITYGGTATLSVAAKLHTSLSGDLSYQWYQKEGATGKALDNGTSDSLSLSGLTAGTYTYYCVITCGSYTVTSDEATVTVGQATGSVSITGDPGKTYDGTAVSMVDKYTFTGDGTVTVEYTERGKDSYSTTAPKDAGDYTVKVTKAAGTNYTEASATEDFTIAKREVTITGTTVAATKTYDGDTNATITNNGALSVNYDDGNLSFTVGTASYDNKNVGENKNVTFSGFALTGSAAGNYELTAQPTSVKANITPMSVTAKVTVTPKAYDGTDTAEVTAVVTTTEGLIPDDTITITGLTGTFDNANAGTDKAVAVNAAGKSITGTGSGNYNVTIPTTATGTISRAALGAAVTLDDWTYGDTPQDPVVTGNTENGEVTYLYKVWSASDETYSPTVPTEAGKYSVKATIAATANYQQAVVYDDFTIKPKTLTVTGLTATDRVYDGTKDVTLTGGTLSGIVAGDENLVSATMPTTGTIANADAGNGKPVTYATILLTGGKSENYALSQPAVTVNIEPLGVDEPTVTGTYTYDRTQKTVTLDGFESSYMTVTGNTGTNAGAYTATVTLDANHKWNEGSDGSIQWTIARKEVTAAVTVTTKTYDGNTDATVSAEVTTTGGLIDGDTITIEGLSGTFDNANAGTGKTVTINAENKSITGDDASNYNVTIPDEAKGAITSKTIGIDWTDTTLTYNGTPQKPTATATELEDGDTCTITVTGEKTDAGSYTATATDLDNSNYQLPVENTTTFTIAKKEVTAAPKDVTITRGNAIPAFELTYTGLLGEDTLTPNPAPTFTCYEEDGTTAVSTGTAAGTYTITWTNPDDITFTGGANYQVVPATGTLTINNPSYSNTTTTTVKNEDGSTTTTVTDKTTGTVTETTKNTDGSTTVVETKKDGTVTETNKAADGTTGTVVTDSSGEVTEVKASVSSAAVTEAAKTGETVTLPVEVPAAKTTKDAPAVEVTVPKSAEEVKVEIPVEDVTPGTVAVIVHADGTEEIVKTSTPTETGVALTLGGSATVKIVDNTKVFEDIHPVNHWAKDAVDFVVARGMFTGTSATTFSPNSYMTRAMLMTVLARFDGVDTSGGSVWYEKGMEWAKANGVSDGSNPNGNITREQLATMLWRYAGSPASSHSLDGYTDADNISGYALVAMRWANENGIINGYGNGLLGAKDNATRAQVAQMLMNFVKCLNQ